LHLLVQVLLVLRLVIEPLLCELEADVVLDALAEVLDDILEVFTFGFIQLRLPLRE